MKVELTCPTGQVATKVYVVPCKIPCKHGSSDQPLERALIDEISLGGGKIIFLSTYALYDC